MTMSNKISIKTHSQQLCRTPPKVQVTLHLWWTGQHSAAGFHLDPIAKTWFLRLKMKHQHHWKFLGSLLFQHFQWSSHSCRNIEVDSVICEMWHNSNINYYTQVHVWTLCQAAAEDDSHPRRDCAVMPWDNFDRFRQFRLLHWVQTHSIRMPRARMNLYTIVFMMVDIISQRVGFVFVKTVIARH